MVISYITVILLYRYYVRMTNYISTRNTRSIFRNVQITNMGNRISPVMGTDGDTIPDFPATVTALFRLTS